MFSNNSISIRLFNGYFIIIIFLGIITIVSLVKLGSVNYLKKSLMDNYAQIECISNLELNKEKLITKTRMQVKKGNEHEVAEDCLNILNNMGNEASKLTSICINNPLLFRLSNSVKDHCNTLSSEYKAHTNPDNRILLPGINNLGVIIGAFKKEGYGHMERLQGSLKGVIKSAFATLLFFFLITVIYSIFLSINIAASITKPLAKLMDTAKKIRGGDLSARANVNTFDEIRTLSQLFDEMVGTLNNDQTKIKEYNRSLEVKNLELKNISHRLFTVQDEERKRLSQVLHEEIGQAMTALKINFKLLEHYNKSKSELNNNTEFQSCLGDCRVIVDMTFKSLKSLTFSLKYNILDKLGIIEASKYFFEQVSKRSPVTIITSSNISEEQIPSSIKMHLFRIISEATINVIKHADANTIRIDFVLEKSNFILCFSDNGIGFNVESVIGNDMSEYHMGMTTIKELVNIMNGHLQIISESSMGTSLIIKIPIDVE
ncbi:MAG: HAMP domain-containing protein [Candidatus Scalindua sp.]|nr:HAMP domain-containing protein [Candidatus Scalindua sp.]